MVSLGVSTFWVIASKATVTLATLAATRTIGFAFAVRFSQEGDCFKSDPFSLVLLPIGG